MPPAVVTRHAGGPGDGDFAIALDAAVLRARRDRIAPSDRWTWLRQVHGAAVVTVDAPGAGAGAEADAAVTDVPGALLAIHTADCAPVLLADADAGVIGAAHAGWRGIVAGVLEATLEAMAELGARRIRAEVGPHIRARCYEFGAADLDVVATRYGDDVRARTGWDTPALDLDAAIRAALGARDVPVDDVGGCTGCEPARYFSHRARGDAGRHASTIVLEP